MRKLRCIDIPFLRNKPENREMSPKISGWAEFVAIVYFVGLCGLRSTHKGHTGTK